jgi:hypothetical protein
MRLKRWGTAREAAYPTLQWIMRLTGCLHAVGDGANPGKGKVTQVLACAEDGRLYSSASTCAFA